jgi:hypothetical protein
MHSPTGANTLARMKQKIILTLNIIQTNFAGIFLSEYWFILHDNIVKKRLGLILGLGIPIDSIGMLTDIILNASQFECHART